MIASTLEQCMSLVTHTGDADAIFRGKLCQAVDDKSNINIVYHILLHQHLWGGFLIHRHCSEVGTVRRKRVHYAALYLDWGCFRLNTTFSRLIVIVYVDVLIISGGCI